MSHLGGRARSDPTSASSSGSRRTSSASTVRRTLRSGNSLVSPATSQRTRISGHNDSDSSAISRPNASNNNEPINTNVNNVLGPDPDNGNVSPVSFEIVDGGPSAEHNNTNNDHNAPDENPNDNADDDQSFHDPPPPPLDQAAIMAAITELQNRVQASERQHAEALNTIADLEQANIELQFRLNNAINNQRGPPAADPDPPDSSSDDDSSTTRSDPRMRPQPAALANDNHLLQRLIAAQEEANRLHAEARAEDRRSRIESTSARLPQLKSLTQDAVNDWHQRVLINIKGPKYHALYDNLTNNVVLMGNAVDADLNTVLFTELMGCFTPAIQRYVISKPDLHNDGTGLLRDLHSTFNPTWSQVEKDNQERLWISL